MVIVVSKGGGRRQDCPGYKVRIPREREWHCSG